MPPKKKSSAKGYKLAETLPEGEIVEDMLKNRFKIGPSIGNGGFGMIYSAKEANSTSSKFPYVLKIEPHGNGPLFVESHFYMRNGKQNDVDGYKKMKGLKFLGMPVYHAKGSHEYKGEKYRFLIMDKFGTDLWKLYIENKRQFPSDTVFKVGLQILDVLEYIHSRGYVHADIKPANILLESTKETQTKHVYLVDFGLTSKYTMENEYKPNPKRAHDGTIEYLSRDAHLGVQTRRGDLEILAYNLIQWLGCVLPWETITDPKKVQQSKEAHMENISKFLKTCFESRTPPKALVNYLNYLITLKFNTEPDYDKIRAMFTSGVKEAGGSLDSPLKFSQSKSTPRKRKSPVPISSPAKRTKSNKPLQEVDEMDEDSPIEELFESPKGRKKPSKRKPPAKQNDYDSPSEDTEEDKPTEKKPLKRGGRPKKRNEDVLMAPAKRYYGSPSEDEEEKPTKEKPVKREGRSKKQNENIVIPPTKQNYYDSPSEDEEDEKPSKKKPMKRGNRPKKQNKDIFIAPAEQNDYDSPSEDEGEEKPTKKKSVKRGGRSKKQNEEVLMAPAKRNYGDSSSEGEEKEKPMKKQPVKKLPKENKEVLNNSTDGMTAAMREIAIRLKNNVNTIRRKPRTKAEDKSDTNDKMDGYTDSMKELAAKRKVNKETSKPNGNEESDQSEQEELEGYTDSMKELINKKKLGFPPKVKGVRK